MTMRLKNLLVGAGLLVLASSAPAATLVFATDFDTTLAPQIAAGTATLTGVQGFAGLGSAGNAFGGSFLRSPTANVVTLTLAGLPAHTSLSLDFLFAAIDSLDGTGTFPQGDFLKVTLDGTTVFRESFANALTSQVQSYVPAPGVELARRVELGFAAGSFYADSAYDMAREPGFDALAHSASTAVLTFVMEGEGIQSLDDESWAIDELRVSVTTVPVPAAIGLLLVGCAGLGANLRRRVQH